MELLRDVQLAGLTTIEVGGPARHFVHAREEAEVLEALDWARYRGERVHVLGGGSNVVVADDGVPGLVLRMGTRNVAEQRTDSAVELTVAAGEPWDELVARTVRQDLAGLECLSGIPGLAGATPIQNVGAFGQEVAETIVRVRVADRATLEVHSLSAADCRFAYRDSLFKSQAAGQYLVLDVTFRLIPGGPAAVRQQALRDELDRRGQDGSNLAEVRDAVLNIRRGRSMVYDRTDPNHRSCGSFFTNPCVDAGTLEAVERRVGGSDFPRWQLPDGRTKLAAGWLIEHAGFARGLRAERVGLSTEHALCLVAHDGARAADVVAFAYRLREGVQDRFGVRLVAEPFFWGFSTLDGGLPAAKGSR